MNYISFDVGIKNLSYCIIEINNNVFDIIDWNVIALCDSKDKVNKINLINVGKTLKDKLEVVLNKFSIDMVLIENQIGPLALRMKVLQGMIIQHFIENYNKNIVIESINPINKLKEFIGDKQTSYKERKKMKLL